MNGLCVRPADPIPSTRILSLDGLRAVSIGLVVFLHLSDSKALSHSLLPVNLAQCGYFGVHIFFVISGFVITLVLLRGEERNGEIGFREFYLRRAFRIFPPALFFLSVLLALNVAGVTHINYSEFLTCLIFAHNLFIHSIELRHFWSLSVEEQFYLFYPILLFLLHRKRPRILFFICLFALYAPLVIFVRHRLTHTSLDRNDFAVGYLIAGCILALLRGSSGIRWLRGPVLQWRLVPYLSIAALALTFRFESAEGIWLHPVRAVLLMVLINYLAEDHDRFADYLFCSWPMVKLGQWSYSVYLWQQLFCRAESGYWFQTFPLNVILSLILAGCSYEFIENPARRLGKKWETTPAPKAIADYGASSFFRT